MVAKTPNQIVASNIVRARKLRQTRRKDGQLTPMSQLELAKLVEPLLGASWGKTAVPIPGDPIPSKQRKDEIDADKTLTREQKARLIRKSEDVRSEAKQKEDAAKKATISAWERSVDGGTREKPFTVNELVALSLALELSPLWFLLPPRDEDGVPDVKPSDHAKAFRRVGNDKEEGPTLSPGDLLDLLFFRGWTDIEERLSELDERHRGDAWRRQGAILDASTRAGLGELEEIESWLAGIEMRARDLQLRFGAARERARREFDTERERMRSPQAKEDGPTYQEVQEQEQS